MPRRYVFQGWVLQKLPALPERRIRHRDRIGAQIMIQKIEFRPAMLKIVQNLIDQTVSGQAFNFFHVIDIEVRNTPAPDQPVILQILERADRLFKRRSPRQCSRYRSSQSVSRCFSERRHALRTPSYGALDGTTLLTR